MSKLDRFIVNVGNPEMFANIINDGVHCVLQNVQYHFQSITFITSLGLDKITFSLC